MPNPNLYFVVSDNKKHVGVNVVTQSGACTDPIFWYECGSQIEAIALGQYLQSILDDTVERIRSQAYNQGWADAKAKKLPKCDRFYPGIGTDLVGWRSGE